MQKARRHRSEERLRPLVSMWFQILFHFPFGELFIIQSPYWSTIGHRGVFRLGGWSPHVHAEFHGLHATLGHFHTRHYRAITFYGQPFETVHDATWKNPLSLAATYGISVDSFSSGYLDVSLHQVRSHTVCIRVWVTADAAGFPHSETLGSKLVCQLPEAYRRLQRLSSPLDTKTSTTCS